MYRLNHYSIILIITYILAFLAMQIGAQNSWIEGLTSLPVIILTVLWSERVIPINNDLNRSTFNRDMFIIAYSCLLAFVASLIFQSNNVDARGWWPLVIVIGAMYGILIGLIYAAFATLLRKEHDSYTNKFGIALFLGYFVISLLPLYFNFASFSQTHLFISFIILLLGFHLLICLGAQLTRKHRS